MSEAWIVQRIESDGSPTRTIELPEDEAAIRYSNWCENSKRFNDQSISLIKVFEFPSWRCGVNSAEGTERAI